MIKYEVETIPDPTEEDPTRMAVKGSLGISGPSTQVIREAAEFVNNLYKMIEEEDKGAAAFLCLAIGAEIMQLRFGNDLMA